jgi:hypothetical protein
MSVQTTSDPSQRVRPASLWFGATAGAVAWALQGFTCFEIAVQACADGTGNWGPLSGPGVRILLGCVTLGYLAVAAASGFVSYRNWRTLSNHRQLTHAEGIGREEFMAIAGFFVGAAAVIGLIWAGIPSILIPTCSSYR